MRQILINNYLKVKDNDQYTWDVLEYAGMYLYKYPEDPITALTNDIHNISIPSVIGRQVKVVIMSALRAEER